MYRTAGRTLMQRALRAGGAGPGALPPSSALAHAHYTAVRALSTVGARPHGKWSSEGHRAGWERAAGLGVWATAGALLGAAGLQRKALADADADADEDAPEPILNWSNTHECRPKAYHQPESVEELEALVAAAHTAGRKLRPIGSALSPNGLGFSDEELVSLAMLDSVVHVDPATQRITVQAGARVRQVTEELRKHGLVLQNYASIDEQQIGGFTQVGAHGTGAAIPPVDETVVALKLVTPGRGTLELSREHDPELFQLAKVAMGTLGVVAEATLQCVPAYQSHRLAARPGRWGRHRSAHQLHERMFVATRAWVKENHARLLREHKHIRFMWIPYTDSVVVVGSNPLQPGDDPAALLKAAGKQMSEYKKVAPLRDLLKKVAPEYNTWARRSEVNAMNFAQLRDALLAVAPLDTAHVRAVNQAEAAFWANNQGVRIDWSDRILGFECGGEQWVSEVAFPAGTLAVPSGADMSYMDEVLALIERENIPAPAPIEQRWTSSSSSRMSIASSPGDPETMHSWVGIIMYLPTADPAQRAAITQRFTAYKELCMDELWKKFGAVEHWAKVELPEGEARKAQLLERMAARFPVAAFNQARAALDPKNILSNQLVDTIFPRPSPGPLAWLFG